MRKPESYTKRQMLKHWSSLEPRQALRPRAVPYKHKGSTYDQDGIRLTGSRQWIDSVLSQLKDLLCYEGSTTRLQVVYKQSQNRETGALLDSWNCYVQVHRRGNEAAYFNLKYDAHKNLFADVSD